MKFNLLKVRHMAHGSYAWFRRLSLRKKILFTIVVSVLLITIVRTVSGSGKPTYTVVKATKADIVEVVTETGSVAVGGVAPVYSPTNGIVSEVFVINGLPVEDGQDLFSVQSSATEQEQQQAYANYLAAQAALDDATAAMHTLRSAMYNEWDTYYGMATGDRYETGDGQAKETERLDPEFQMAQDEWYAAEKQYKQQQVVVTQAQASVSSTWLLYQATQDSVVKATIAGQVSNLAITQGSTVAVKSPTAATPPALTITQDVVTEVVVALSESDIAKIKTGQRVTIQTSTGEKKTFKGVVRRFDTIGTNDAGVIRYNVYVEVMGAANALLPGMTVDTTIITKSVQDVVSVPNAAVKPYQGGRAVRIVDPKTKEMTYVRVEVGIRGEERTQILKGINENQEVITALSNEQIKRSGVFGN